MKVEECDSEGREVIFIDNSNPVEISKFTFKKNMAKSVKQAIDVRSSVVTEFIDSEFSTIEQTVIHFYSSNISNVMNVTFEDSLQGVSLAESDFSVESSKFMNLGKQSSDITGAAIMSTNSDLEVINATFLENKGESGAAVNLDC